MPTDHPPCCAVAVVSLSHLHCHDQCFADGQQSGDKLEGVENHRRGLADALSSGAVVVGVKDASVKEHIVQDEQAIGASLAFATSPAFG